MKSRLLLASLVAIASPCTAGTLDLRIVDAAGKPVPDAVVTVVPGAGIPPGPISFPWGTTMAQQDISFKPHVLIVPVGATVRFPNLDTVRHHIYSFSKPAKFEIKLFGKDETRSYRFTSAGAVAIGCNIHDMMSAFIKVVNTPYAGKSASNGMVRIASIPNGPAQVTVWHPDLRAKDNELRLSIPSNAGTVSQTITLTLRRSG